LAISFVRRYYGGLEAVRSAGAASAIQLRGEPTTVTAPGGQPVCGSRRVRSRGACRCVARGNHDGRGVVYRRCTRL